MSHDSSSSAWPVRVWPGLLIAAGVAFVMVVPALVLERSMLRFMMFMLAPILGTILATIWWAAFPRIGGAFKWAILGLFWLPLLALSALEIADARPPLGPLIFGAPFIVVLWAGWLAASITLAPATRQAGLVIWMAAGWVAFGLLRLDGTDAEMIPEFSFRFSPKPEDRAARDLNNRPTVAPAKPLAESAKDSLDWAEFRGPNRDGIVRGISIDTDWAANPPKQLWKQKIGPGWGTFSVVGDRLFTQEQRGDQEATVCYDAATGGEIWKHFEKAKFTESIAGAGPRATPTVVDGKLYSMGATGILVCLKAEDGAEIWKADITKETGGAPPTWGYSSSPLVLDGLVFVYAGGPDGKGTAAYDAATGQFAWAAGNATHSYSSAQRAAIAGVAQVLMLSDYGLESFEPKTGKLLWEYKVFIKGMNRVSQPTPIAEGEFLIGTFLSDEQGTRRLKVKKEGADWKVEVVWSTTKVRPYFNDGSIHGGYFYGFDDKKLVCVDLKDGSTRWDAGTQFGHGQVLMLGDQGLLVIQAVDGKVYLLEATPEEPRELGKFAAIPGKTWNHPVVNRGKLYVRNGTWAAAYELKGK